MNLQNDFYFSTDSLKVGECKGAETFFQESFRPLVISFIFSSLAPYRRGR